MALLPSLGIFPYQVSGIQYSYDEDVVILAVEYGLLHSASDHYRLHGINSSSRGRAGRLDKPSVNWLSCD